MSTPEASHLSFPFRIGSDGRTAQTGTVQEHVGDEVEQLVLTNQGERLWVPDFGGGARRLVFQGRNEATETMAKAMLSQSLERWLGHRVTVEELTVEGSDAQITIELKYRIAGTQDGRIVRFQHHG
jgi:phage baseplate assembly protein W